MENSSYIKGTVVKILFESSTGYKVGLFKVKESSDDEVKAYINKTITFTGTFMPINNELTYEFRGKLVNHPRFGVQFNVTSYESVIPDTDDAIVMYLSSGIFKGIGPKTAKAIVDVFHEETINEIKNGNPILSKIKGMNERKAHELTRKMIEYDKDQEIIIEFNKMGFTTEECLKLVNKYKDRCFDIISINIYLLENDISFLKLDKIFLNLHDENESVRINAIIKFGIRSLCYQSGDTVVSPESLFLEVNKYFSNSLDSKVFLSHIDDLEEENLIIKIDNTLALREFYETEANIAYSINSFNKIRSSFDVDLINKKIEIYEKDNGISFNDIQKEAILGSLINNFFIITGGPGTGKTTIIKAIVDIYESLTPTLEQGDITLLAPTGRASKRISESVNRKTSTIHKFLKWNKETKEFSVNKWNPSDTKLVIIDEASMVDIFLFNSLLEGLRSNVKLILVGDANQLPSIAPGNILGDLLECNLPNVFLDFIYRTKEDSFIIPLSTLIKNREEFKIPKIQYDDFTFINSEDILIKKYIKEVCVKAKDKGIDIDEFQVLIPMYKGENGIDNINILMQSIFNPESSKKREVIIRDIVYREGDKVIQLVNDVDNNIYNGDIGYIESIIPGKNVNIIINYNGNKVNYKKSKFDEFTHAYSISVHKSQGSEYNQVLIVIPSNMKRMLYNKLIYTAVTRAKKGLIIIGSVDSFNYSIKETYSENRITSLRTFF